MLAARAPLAVEVDVDLPERLPEHVQTAAYYAVSEALANVVKHASATSASVRVERLDDRVETLDGALSIDGPPGGGTLLRAELPVGLDSFTPVGRDG